MATFANRLLQAAFQGISAHTTLRGLVASRTAMLGRSLSTRAAAVEFRNYRSAPVGDVTASLDLRTAAEQLIRDGSRRRETVPLDLYKRVMTLNRFNPNQVNLMGQLAKTRAVRA